MFPRCPEKTDYDRGNHRGSGNDTGDINVFAREWRSRRRCKPARLGDRAGCVAALSGARLAELQK